MKNCKKCGELKPLDQFSTNKSNKDGHNNECKACEKIRKAAYYLKNKDKILARNKQWHEENRDQAIEVQKIWREINIEADRENKRAYFDKNVDNIKSNSKKYRQSHKEEMAAYAVRYRLEHPEHSLCNNARTRAKKQGIPFDITKEDIFIPTHCPVLGIELKPGKIMTRDNSPSIDRLIPSLGYVRGNVEVISWRANSLKRDGTLEELELLVQWLRSKLKTKAA